MNRWLQHKVLWAKYRKYAVRISAVVHIILLIVCPLFFIHSELQELEDEIQVELIPDPNVLIDPPKTKLKVEIPKEEPAPEPPKPEMPVPAEKIAERKKITLQKDVDVVKAEQSPVEVAKLPARSQTSVDIQQPSPKRLDVDAAALSQTPDLATDADLPASPESVLSPIGAPEGSPEHDSTTRRRNSGARSPKKGAGEGSGDGKRAKDTGAAAGTKDIGAKSGGSGDGSDTFSSIIAELTDDIIASSGGLPVDVVFVVDASGSMQDNINAVAEHLGQMVDTYKASEIDYQLGLSHFNMAMGGTPQQNNIQVFQLTRDMSIYKRRLYEIVPTGDENALDAINQTIGQLRFRTDTIKHLILVTDEPFTSLQGHTADTIIKLCQRNELYVNVLGLNMPDHKRLATETGGSWHAVPQDPLQQGIQTAQSRPAVPQTIGDIILADGANIPVDVILFIDSSKSMTDKVSYLTEQIDLWIRNWDNAMIDYRIGIVRFRAKQSVNIVNVFKPPQTKERIHSILQLPCQDDENLLHAVVDGVRRIQRRPHAKTHFILITDEPGNPKAPFEGTIALLKDLPVTVSVLGAADNFQQQVAAQTSGVYVTIPNGHKKNMLNQ